jgi:YHS domain-containing protein
MSGDHDGNEPGGESDASRRVEEVDMVFTEGDGRFDVFNRFARRYLADADQRAVYAALVGELGVVWRVETLASRLGLRIDAVLKVLSVFEAAGIVASRTEDGDRCFVWRSDVGYLFDGREEAELPVDPVCQMSVVEDSPYRTRDPRGREYVFCSSKCLETFRALMDRPDGGARLTRLREERQLRSRPTEAVS